MNRPVMATATVQDALTGSGFYRVGVCLGVSVTGTVRHGMGNTSKAQGWQMM